MWTHVDPRFFRRSLVYKANVVFWTCSKSIAISPQEKIQNKPLHNSSKLNIFRKNETITKTTTKLGRRRRWWRRPPPPPPRQQQQQPQQLLHLLPFSSSCSLLLPQLQQPKSLPFRKTCFKMFQETKSHCSHLQPRHNRYAVPLPRNHEAIRSAPSSLRDLDLID